MRLDKLLSENGYGSKRTLKKLLFSKQVSVNGQIVMKENLTVDPNIQIIKVQNKRLTSNTNVYYMLHKPAGVVSAVSDKTYKTVMDLLSPSDYKPNIFPVGRLDYNTTGLLLLTNNGRLAYQMLHPKFHVTKQYEVTVNGLLTEQDIVSFKKGIVFLDGTVCKSAKLELLSCLEHESIARVTIQEGKFHQIKKMFLSVGVKVTKLKRISFGKLQLDSQLKEGEYRLLTDMELQKLVKYFK